MDTMKRDAVVIKGLTKCYTRKARSSGRQDESVNSASDRQAAVDHIDLTIREGELLALLGVNGAGKTTTIRMLSGLSVPTEGDAEVLGHAVVREQAEVKKLIGISVAIWVTVAVIILIFMTFILPKILYDIYVAGGGI